MDNMDINNINSQNFDRPKSQINSPLTNLEYWNYEWEKAYVDQRNASQQPISNSDGATQERSGHSKTELKNQMSATGYIKESQTVGYEGSFFVEKNVHIPDCKIKGASSNISNNGDRHSNLPSSEHAFLQASNISSEVALERSSEVKLDAEGKSRPVHWQFLARFQPATTGILVYKDTENQLKVWLRDKSLSKQNGLKVINELRTIFSTLGLSLAAVTLNGELLAESNQDVKQNITDEVVS